MDALNADEVQSIVASKRKTKFSKMSGGLPYALAEAGRVKLAAPESLLAAIATAGDWQASALSLSYTPRKPTGVSPKLQATVLPVALPPAATPHCSAVAAVSPSAAARVTGLYEGFRLVSRRPRGPFS